jgi:hypothetical protein
MPKKQGDRLNIGELKSSIIAYILENVEDVGEPAIRDFLLQKYDLMDQGNINRHLHDLQKLDCIELIPPQKKGLRNYWNITKVQNLKNIRHEFPELQLNIHEKSITIIIKEIEDSKDTLYWLKLYIKLFISTSFFNTCLELGIRKLEQEAHKIYITNSGSYRHQSINDILKVCYLSCVKYYSNFEMSEKEFTEAMTSLNWELLRFYDKEYLLNHFETYFPALPKKIPLEIFKTKLAIVENIPEEMPDEIDRDDLVIYMLHTIWLIIEHKRSYLFSRDDLLLKHFFNHDILLGVDSKDEHYFVEKTIENHTQPHTLFHTVSTTLLGPTNIIMRNVGLADLKLASEIISKYKQEGRFSYFSSQLDKVYQMFINNTSNFYSDYNSARSFK